MHMCWVDYILKIFAVWKYFFVSSYFSLGQFCAVLRPCFVYFEQVVVRNEISCHSGKQTYLLSEEITVKSCVEYWNCNWFRLSHHFYRGLAHDLQHFAVCVSLSDGFLVDCIELFLLLFLEPSSHTVSIFSSIFISFYFLLHVLSYFAFFSFFGMICHSRGSLSLWGGELQLS